MTNAMMIDNPEPILEEIKAKQSQLKAFQVKGASSLSFQGQTPLLSGEYDVKYRSQPRFSAEINASYDKAGQDQTKPFFAYLHNGYLLEHKQEQWHRDSLGILEEIIPHYFRRIFQSNSLLTPDYIQIYDRENGYVLSLKNDLNAHRFYVDILNLVDLQAVETAFSQSSPAQIGLIKTLLEEERIKEAIANAKFEAIVDKASYQILKNYISFSLNSQGIEVYLQVDAQSVPERLVFITENDFSHHDDEFDFSFLDEVAPK